MNSDKKYFSIPEAAQAFGVGRTTVWRWVKSGEIKAVVTPGGHHRIRHSEISSFLASGNGADERRSISEPNESTILLVDDDSAMRETVSKMVKKAGYRLSTASNGFEAGMKITRSGIDLVILDIVMPGINGIDVCRLIRKNGALDNIRILAITGYDSPENRERILSAGADDYLPKPFGRKDLMEKMHNLLADASHIPVSGKGKKLARHR